VWCLRVDEETTGIRTWSLYIFPGPHNLYVCESESSAWSSIGSSKEQNVEVKESRDRTGTIRWTDWRKLTSVYKTAAFYINITAYQQRLLMMKAIIYAPRHWFSFPSWCNHSCVSAVSKLQDIREFGFNISCNGRHYKRQDVAWQVGGAKLGAENDRLVWPLYVVHIHAPSGTSRRSEKEENVTGLSYFLTKFRIISSLLGTSTVEPLGRKVCINPCGMMGSLFRLWVLVGSWKNTEIRQLYTNHV